MQTNTRQLRSVHCISRVILYLWRRMKAIHTFTQSSLPQVNETENTMNEGVWYHLFWCVIAAKHNSRACTTHIYTLPSYRTRPPYDTICQNKWAQHDSNCDASVCVCFLYNACIFCISLTLTGIHSTLTADEKCLLVCVCVYVLCSGAYLSLCQRYIEYTNIYKFLTVRVHHTKTFVMF